MREHVEKMIRVQGLSKWYPLRRGLGEWLRAPFRKESIRAVHDVTFDVEGGEILALLGPNGSGKTTILKVLSSLVLPTRGTARVAGLDVARESLRARRLVGCSMSEERSFYFRLTGRQNLRFFGRLLGIPGPRIEEKIEDAVALLGLGEIDERFMTYSTGTRQKLSAARALLAEAPVLLLDEPTRGLDPYTSSLFLERVRSLARKEGKAVLFASHDLGAVERVADRLVFLHRGELLAEGDPDHVLRRFQVPATIDLRVKRGALSKEALISFPGVEDAVHRGESGELDEWRVGAGVGEFPWDRFFQRFREEGVALSGLEIRRGSLEELYRRFAGEERS